VSARVALVWGLVAALCLPAAAASAQRDERDVSLAEARARSMFERAIVELGAGHAAAGRDLLRQSLAILPTPATRFNLAVALRETGELTDARVQLEELERDESLEPAVRSRVERLREEIDAAIATLVIREAEPGDAPTEVEVDGVAVGALEGTATLRVSVDPGEHRVSGLRETFRGAASVTVANGETRRVELRLSPFTEPAGEVEAWPFVVGGIALAVVGGVLAVTLALVLGEPAHPEAIDVPALLERP